MILGFAVGVVAGLMIAGIGLACFTDVTLLEFVGKLQSVQLGETMLAAGIAVVSFFVSMALHISLHEAGHLVCGLLSGYRFVSFRIFNFTMIKIDGKLRVKRYGIAGTGGQCLLSPPELPLEEIPVGWYNLGGVLANIFAVLLAIPFLYIVDHPIAGEIVVVFMLAGVFVILVNGVPMKIGGMANDAYNMLALKKDRIAKRAFVQALQGNAMLQNGVRPKDMPEEWFAVPLGINYKNQLHVSLPLMAASRMMDELRFAEALQQYEDLYGHRQETIDLYVKEIECELVFLRLVAGNIDGAKELLDKSLTQYIKMYSRMMSSKERIRCIISLMIDNDRPQALDIYEALRARQNDYLLQGEVKSDLAVMEAILFPFNAWILLQGVETLPLRIERHVENALRVLRFLAQHPKVRSVSHPSLPSHKDHALYKKYSN